MEQRRRYDNMTDSQKMDLLLEQQEEILHSFPYGTDQHRREHEEMENSRQANNKLIQEIKSSLLKTGILALILFISSLLLIGANVRLQDFLKGVPHVQ